MGQVRDNGNKKQALLLMLVGSRMVRILSLLIVLKEVGILS